MTAIRAIIMKIANTAACVSAKGWFGLHRSQRIEGRNLHEALHDKNEGV